jgi:hypothetical protein
MAQLPITAQFKRYTGAKPELRRKAAEAIARAERIATHLNRLIAANPGETQQYYFASMAINLGVTTEQVRSAVSDGGYNGITLWVTPADRERLASHGYLP